MTIDVPRLVLASASPRRSELLKQIGVDFEILPVEIEESPGFDEVPEDYIMRVAADKARAAAGIAGPHRMILAADTEVVLDGRVFGKPENFDDFAGMLRRLSGCEHEVMSAVVLRHHDQSYSALSTSRVRFAALSESAIAAYWRTGEPLGKAGGYAIQGLGAIFITYLSGSYSAVMGLPLHETAMLLEQAGIPFLGQTR